MGNDWVFPSYIMGKLSTILYTGKIWEVDTDASPKLWLPLFHQIPLYDICYIIWLICRFSHDPLVVWVLIYRSNLAKPTYHIGQSCNIDAHILSTYELFIFRQIPIQWNTEVRESSHFPRK